MPESRELRRKRGAIVQEMHDLTSKTSWPEEAQRRWKQLDSEQKELESRIARAETDELTRMMDTVIPPPQPPIGDGFAGFEQRTAPPQESYSTSNNLKPFQRDLASAEYRDSFDCYMRRGESLLSSRQRDLLVTTTNELRSYAGLNTSTSDDAGGYTVPLSFQKELEVRLKAYGRIRAHARILNTSGGGPLDWPAMNDVDNEGEFVGEASPVSQQNPSFDQIQFGSYLCSSKQVLISVQLLQDSAFNLQDVLAEAFGVRVGRRLNRSYTTGTGHDEPTGLITSILADESPNVVFAHGSGSNDGDSGHDETNSIGSDDLEDLVGALDPDYRSGAMFMCHPHTLDWLRKLKDKYGRPLWINSVQAGQPDSLLGFPFDYNVSMDEIGSGKYPILFGNLSKFLVRDVGGFQVFRFSETYMVNHQVGFMGWMRSDSKRLQKSAFQLLKNAAS